MTLTFSQVVSQDPLVLLELCALLAILLYMAQLAGLGSMLRGSRLGSRRAAAVRPPALTVSSIGAVPGTVEIILSAERREQFEKQIRSFCEVGGLISTSRRSLRPKRKGLSLV